MKIKIQYFKILNESLLNCNLGATVARGNYQHINYYIKAHNQQYYYINIIIVFQSNFVINPELLAIQIHSLKLIWSCKQLCEISEAGSDRRHDEHQQFEPARGLASLPGWRSTAQPGLYRHLSQRLIASEPGSFNYEINLNKKIN